MKQIYKINNNATDNRLMRTTYLDNGICVLELVLLRYINEEGTLITKTKYFYGKTKEEAEFKCRKHLLKASSK